MEKKEIKSVITSISLSEHILKNIQFKEKYEDFNLSTWIIDTYNKEFKPIDYLNKIILKNIEENKIIDEIIKAKQTTMNV